MPYIHTYIHVYMRIICLCASTSRLCICARATETQLANASRREYMLTATRYISATMRSLSLSLSLSLSFAQRASRPRAEMTEHCAQAGKSIAYTQREAYTYKTFIYSVLWPVHLCTRSPKPLYAEKAAIRTDKADRQAARLTVV